MFIAVSSTGLQQGDCCTIRSSRGLRCHSEESVGGPAAPRMKPSQRTSEDSGKALSARRLRSCLSRVDRTATMRGGWQVDVERDLARDTWAAEAAAHGNVRLVHAHEVRTGNLPARALGARWGRGVRLRWAMWRQSGVGRRDAHSSQIARVKSGRYRVHDLVIDIGLARVTRDANDVALPKLSFDLLIALVEGGAQPRVDRRPDGASVAGVGREPGNRQSARKAPAGSAWRRFEASSLHRRRPRAWLSSDSRRRAHRSVIACRVHGLCPTCCISSSPRFDLRRCDRCARCNWCSDCTLAQLPE